MENPLSVIELSVLLAFAKLGRTQQDRILAAVNEYLLASLPRRHLMIDLWKSGADQEEN